MNVAACQGTPRLRDAEFAAIADLMRRVTGIELGPGKRALVEARLQRRLRALHLASYADYLEYLASDREGDELVQLIDVVSTNVTSFFREPEHFRFLAELTDRWLGEGRRRLRFWSAACSSGEEAYSLAMTVAHAARRTDLRILATDISTRVLRQAVQGNYPEEAVATVPPESRRRWFRESVAGGRRLYRVADELKHLIMFRRLNLSRTPLPVRGVFDAVLCRNVMIYFGGAVRRQLVAELHRLLRPGGYLMIGHAETLLGMDEGFAFEAPSIYRRLD